MERDFTVRPRSNNKKKIQKPAITTKLPVAKNDSQNIQDTEIIKKQIDASRIKVASDLFSSDMIVDNSDVPVVIETSENFM
jgi:hypothetical protein